ncbi:E3 ubiquitin-protein ligase SHPRH-like isoform X2 [Corticium candelabrum]|uniref:E3 ubiquitin-protein ligase SHPRH-like isoform X2 n=1 Tax=Corticium candelabrum TaxID=121492 RepID=UPI002E26CC4F|nr:E3 ubiquitin-protein ligase SHPRH-like isoform X2 [Corticium candelabrum]
MRRKRSTTSKKKLLICPPGDESSDMMVVETSTSHRARVATANKSQPLTKELMNIKVEITGRQAAADSACARTQLIVGGVNFVSRKTCINSLDEMILTLNLEDWSLIVKGFCDMECVQEFHNDKKCPLIVFQSLQSLCHHRLATLTGKMSSHLHEQPVVTVEFGLSERIFVAETCQSGNQQRNSYGQKVKQLIDFLYPQSEIMHVQAQSTQPLLPDIDSLYSAIRKEQRTRGLLDAFDPHYVPHPALLPDLRRYQKMAVQWMIQRETYRRKETDEIHQLWQEIKTNDSCLYYNQYTGGWSRKKFLKPTLPTGGILADEIGLGKTVEVLACILGNRMPDKQQDLVGIQADKLMEQTTDELVVHCVCGCQEKYLSPGRLWMQCEDCRAWLHQSCVGVTPEKDENFICFRCWTTKEPIECKTTLIISPASIAQQWIEEIEKHVQPGTLSYMIYNGVAHGFVNPLKLAKFDVVVTTYETLKHEVNHVGLNYDGGRSMRHQKRYVPMPSPLMSLKWWRICLDEAQMVESTTAKAAEMTSRLVSIHSWCVTGTPIQKTLQDLYGLLLFLGVSPYSCNEWWRKLLLWPYTMHCNAKPLIDLLSQLFWRNARQDVADELQLPPHKQNTEWLNFSSTEAFFYQRQQESCLQEASKVFSKCGSGMDTRLDSLDRREAHKMMIPLLRLRQACCHPQLVRGKFINVTLQKSSITMEELLTRLISKTRRNCAESHRQIIFALNGLAGIHALKQEVVEAVENYREAMQSWEEYVEILKTDHSQKIHTLYNLSSLLKTNSTGCGRTLRDDTLDEEVSTLKDEYLSLVTARVKTAIDKLKVIHSLVQEGQSKLNSKNPWWILALDMANAQGVGPQLVSSVRGKLSEAHTTGRLKEMSTVADSIRSVHGLSLVVDTTLTELQVKREKVVAIISQLAEDLPSKNDIQMAAVCHLRKLTTHFMNIEKCAICRAESLLHDYEQILFAIRGSNTSRNVDDELFPEEVFDGQGAAVAAAERHANQHTLVTWGDSEVEQILKHVASFVKSISPTDEMLSESQVHLSLFENLKKELRGLKAVWLVLDQRIAALDELEMATTTLRFRQPGEPLADPPDSSVIEIRAVESHQLQFQSDLLLGREELRKHLGQLRYLQTLEKNQDEISEENVTPCPICGSTLGVEWSVLTCGHCVCCSCSCYVIAKAKADRSGVKCPLCRFVMQPAELTYVSVNSKKRKGSHSTKVEAIVRCVLTIENENREAKILIFSTWMNVLDIVARAMDQNNITYRLINSRQTFQRNLTEFKQNSDIRVCLMPLHSGSNGLNIIEASYVLLVEPSLNPAIEQQAVGRVYRIGQTKSTHVYRFYVNLTVESRIYEVFQQKSVAVCPAVRSRLRTEGEQLTLGDLSHLFEDNDVASSESETA